MALQLAPCSGQALLEVLHHMKAINRHDHLVAKHFACRRVLAVPHIDGDFRHGIPSSFAFRK